MQSSIIELLGIRKYYLELDHNFDIHQLGNHSAGSAVHFGDLGAEGAFGDLGAEGAFGDLGAEGAFGDLGAEGAFGDLGAEGAFGDFGHGNNLQLSLKNNYK